MAGKLELTEGASIKNGWRETSSRIETTERLRSQHTLIQE